MATITINAYAKINLTLDVLGTLPNGYHEVEMIMQQVSLCDRVSISQAETNPGNERNELEITLNPGREDLPSDKGNLAYRAALLMWDLYKDKMPPSMTTALNIDIEKHIPVAAGLAGGSSNCAAVIHGLNQLWKLNLSLSELCDIGAKLGSDVPFCIMGQAAANETLINDFKKDPLACHCALAKGTGTDMTPLKGLDTWLVLSKPPVGVSTAEVYKGIDSEEILKRPNTAQMIEAMAENNYKVLEKNMINVLENFTLKRYSNIVYTKNKMSELYKSGCSLMSGSGPTVFCLCKTKEDAADLCTEMLQINSESFLAHTTV